MATDERTLPDVSKVPEGDIADATAEK